VTCRGLVLPASHRGTILSHIPIGCRLHELHFTWSRSFSCPAMLLSCELNIYPEHACQGCFALQFTEVVRMKRQLSKFEKACAYTSRLLPLACQPKFTGPQQFLCVLLLRVNTVAACGHPLSQSFVTLTRTQIQLCLNACSHWTASFCPDA